MPLEGQKLCSLVWELGTEAQGHLLGGTEACWGQKSHQIPQHY